MGRTFGQYLKIVRAYNEASKSSMHWDNRGNEKGGPYETEPINTKPQHWDNRGNDHGGNWDYDKSIRGPQTYDNRNTYGGVEAAPEINTNKWKAGVVPPKPHSTETQPKQSIGQVLAAAAGRAIKELSDDNLMFNPKPDDQHWVDEFIKHFHALQSKLEDNEDFMKKSQAFMKQYFIPLVRGEKGSSLEKMHSELKKLLSSVGGK